jgi:hypothetical protein
MQKTGFFTKFAVFLFKVSAWLSNHAVCQIGLSLLLLTSWATKALHNENIFAYAFS